MRRYLILTDDHGDIESFSLRIGEPLKPSRLLAAIATALAVAAQFGIAIAVTTGTVATLLAATDGHAKNFSIFLLPGGSYRLTPLYDVMSAYPVMGDGPNQWSPRELKLAMALVGKSRHYEAERIQRRHFNSTARRLSR